MISQFSEDKETNSFSDGIDADANLAAGLTEISDITTTASDWTIETILGLLIRENIQLSPRSQGRDNWNLVHKSRFIESLSLGFPTPQIVLAVDAQERNKFIVIDGSQRLETILEFYGRSETENNGFTLTGLEFRTDLNGCNYDSIESNYYLNSALINLDIQTIRVVLIRDWDSPSLLHKISSRLNLPRVV